MPPATALPSRPCSRSDGYRLAVAGCSELAPGRGVRSLCERCCGGEELLRLAGEETAGGKSVDGADGGADGLGRAKDRADRELPVEEDGRLRHDPVRLQVFAALVEVGEDEAVGRVGERRSVAGFVLPGLEMHDLCRADAEQDAQDF